MRLSLHILGAALAVLLLAGPARAGEVIVVGGERAKRVDDPAVPTQAEIALPPAPGATAAPVARSAARPRADRRAVYGALRSPKVDSADRRRWRRGYVRALRTYRRLRGARREQLGYVVDSLEALALGGRLGATRMPGAFAQLERNRRYWRRYAFPASGDQVSFRGSELLYQYFPGRGLQLHPLSTFKKANHLHGFCVRREPGCDRAGLRRLLDEMSSFAVRRSRRFIAWEYGFHFGGGAPPWISGMAEATAIQALARAADLLGEPRYLDTARRALGAFEARPPRGVRTVGPAGGVHYLQYSFAPRLYIFNAFLQSLIGLHDLGKLDPGSRATELFREAEPEAKEEVPLSDVGDWSRYSYRGAESSRDYHELLREFLQSMCTRRLGRLYCDYAARYRGYMVDPPRLTYTGPSTTTEGKLTPLRFTLSKLSAVEVQVVRNGAVRFSRLATFRRGTGAFAWRPRGPGEFTVRIAAKELRTGLGKRDRATATLTVENVPD